jgi:OOP family OmpA-OmpF porin
MDVAEQEEAFTQRAFKPKGRDMNKRLLLAGMAAGLTMATSAIAQQSSTTQTSEYRWPYQKEFWGYFGASAGESDFSDCPIGLSCDERDTAFKIYGGGKIKDIFGFELGYVDLGKGEFAGGDMRARGVNASLLLNAPIGTASGVHAKLGTTYGWTRISTTAPGVANGKERDFGVSYGLGATIGLSRNWQLRADWDRYRFEFADGDRDLDMYTVGVQYRF